MKSEPTTLQEAIQYFDDPNNCLDYVVTRRWPNGVVCPTCGSQQVIFLANQQRWQCKGKHPKRQFSAKVGTVLEDSPIGLDKWLAAIWMIANCKNGVSSYEIHRALGVTQKSAWFMMHRLRLAMQAGSLEKMSGEVEVDQTFIGGKARNMHLSKREKKIKGTGGTGKVAVMGLPERHGKVRTKVVPNVRKKKLEAGSQIYTDALKSYEGLNAEYIHQMIDHAEAYAKGKVHTNGLENFWSLLKRGLKGTYVSVEPFHLFRYLDEQAFRYNNRKLADAERCSIAAAQILGRRLTYAQLTGKNSALA